MTFLCPQDDCQPIVGEQKPPRLVISVIIEGNEMSKITENSLFWQ